MKKILLPFVVGLLSMPTMAAQMECMVDTANLDTWQVGECMSFEYTLDKVQKNAIWRITGTTKPFSSVLWSQAGAGCASNSLYCQKLIGPYVLHTAKATVLYTDGTWEALEATASFETGF